MAAPPIGYRPVDEWKKEVLRRLEVFEKHRIEFRNFLDEGPDIGQGDIDLPVFEDDGIDELKCLLEKTSEERFAEDLKHYEDKLRAWKQWIGDRKEPEKPDLAKYKFY